MKAFFVLLVAVIAVSRAVSFFDLVLEEWGTFKIQHKKDYKNVIEEKFRMKIYIGNKHMIAKHNAKYELGLVSYKLAINKFADMLPREVISTYTGYNTSKGFTWRPAAKQFDATFIRPANVEIPDAVDWSQLGAVTEVKDQGGCGSCWAFSATGSLEGQHFRKTGKLVSLSEQNLIDCSSKYGNDGCSGGLPNSAFRYIKDNEGIDTEESYPYQEKDDQCRFDPENVGATVVGYSDLPHGEEESLKVAVATVGPISVAIDASRRSFHFYSEGIYDEPQCSQLHLDHAVLAVGYGTEDGKDYWLVKNSWASTWGDNGYIKMARNKNNQCGIASQASYPLV